MQVSPTPYALLMSAFLCTALAVESPATTFEGVGDLPGGIDWSGVTDLSGNPITQTWSMRFSTGAEVQR